MRRAAFFRGASRHHSNAAPERGATWREPIRLGLVIPLLLLALMVASSGALAQGQAPIVRFVVLEIGPTGNERIGVEITDEAIRTALSRIPPRLGPDLIILRIDCAGGMLREVPQLVDLITNELQTRARVVAWVESAVSAAALTALSCGEIVMTGDGAIGAAVTYEMREGEPVALRGEELERALRVGAEIARRTGRDARIIRAMQAPTALSYDVGENGAVTLVDGEGGRVLLASAGTILTLAPGRAQEIGVSLGTADTLTEVMGLLGVRRAQDVGLIAQGSLAQEMKKASEALARMEAGEAALWGALDDARAASDEAGRDAALRRAEEALVGLKADVATWPDAAAYLGLDEAEVGAYGAEIAEIREAGGA